MDAINRISKIAGRAGSKQPSTGEFQSITATLTAAGGIAATQGGAAESTQPHRMKLVGHPIMCQSHSCVHHVKFTRHSSAGVHAGGAAVPD